MSVVEGASVIPANVAVNGVPFPTSCISLYKNRDLVRRK
jgi:hypothetical protein